MGKLDIDMGSKGLEVLTKKTCQTCGGAGQVSSFQGVSRFLLSWEECPECCGLGFIVGGDDDGAEAVEEDGGL